MHEVLRAGVSYCRTEVERLRLLPLHVLSCVAAVALMGCGGKDATGPSSGSSAPVIQTIAELALQNPVQSGPAPLAQSITLPAGGTFNNIRFRWTPFPGAPPITGTLYIIDREDFGPLSAQSPPPGLVARSSGIEGGEYVFSAGVTLTGGTKYWFATDSSVGYLCSQPTSDVYPGGDLYFSGGSSPSGVSYTRAFLFSPTERLDSSFTLRAARVQ